MNLPDVKVVKKARRDGSVAEYYYRRSTGVRIEGAPGTLVFKLNYENAARQSPEPLRSKGEVHHLAEQYLNSIEGKRIAATTKADRRWYVAKIQDEFGHLSLAQVQDDRVCAEFYSWRDSMAKTPVMADRAVTVLKGMLNWARKRKIIRVNQAEDVEQLIDNKERLLRDRSKLVWTDDKIEALFGVCSITVQHAFLLALYTGARIGDLCNLRWDNIQGNWLVYTPSKTRGTTGVEVHLPINELPPLRRLLEHLPKRSHGFILSASRGEALLRRNLQNTYQEYRDKVPGLTLHWHDIRGTTITRLLSAGATPAEAAAISGHSIGAVAGKSSGFSKYVRINQQMATNAYRCWARSGFDGFPLA